MLDSLALARNRNVLAGEAPRDQVGRQRPHLVIRHRRYVIAPPQTRPVLVQHRAAVRLNLDLPDNLHARPLEAKVDHADAREEGEDSHNFTSPLSNPMYCGPFAAGLPLALPLGGNNPCQSLRMLALICCTA